MPSKPRSQVFDPSKVGVYHCWNRLGRSLWLWVLECRTGVDYSYHKRWMYQRLRQLAGAMAIDVLDFADHLRSRCAPVV